MIKTRTWVILIAAAAVVLAAASFFLLRSRSEGTVVQIIQDNTVIREIDLSRVSREYSFVVESPYGGSNTILVQPGRICVSEADCPDRICVYQGWLTDDPIPIVCLPHRLVIALKDPTQAGSDTVSR
jgi:hypothetical protein